MIFIKKCIFFLAGIFLLFLSLHVTAQVPESGALNKIVSSYQTISASWETTIRVYAFRLFWLLVSIDFTWMAILMIFQRMDFSSFFGTLIQRVIIIGFFLSLLQFGTSWSSTVIDSFRSLAGLAGGTPTLNPSFVLDVGIQGAVNLIDRVSGFFSPGNTIIAGLIALGIVFCFVLIAAELVIVLISTWIVLNAGIIMLAFGGARWTQQYAVNYYRTVLALGVRLFIIQLLIGLGISVLQSFINNLSDDPRFAEMFIIVGVSMVLYLLIKSISSLVQSLISGSGDTSTGGTGALIGASLGLASAGAAAASNIGDQAKGAAGAGAAAGAAWKLASEQQGGGEGGTAASRALGSVGAAVLGDAGRGVGEAIGGGLSKVAGTAANLGSAIASDYGARITGEMGAEAGTMGGRMAANMNDKKELLKMEKETDTDTDTDNDSNYITGISNDVIDSPNSDKTL